MKKQPVKKHKRLRKYGAISAPETAIPAKQEPVEEPATLPQDDTPYYLLQQMLGWNPSNPPRVVDKQFILYSYRNRYTASEPTSALDCLVEEGLVELAQSQPSYIYRVTPAGITKLEQKFDVKVEDVQEQFRKRQEENLAKLKRKKVTTDEPKTTRAKKTTATTRKVSSIKSTRTTRKTTTKKKAGAKK